jgi:flagellar hook-length control protein FliK
MQLRLDPPELGALQVRVEMRNGVMTASFETSNDQATRLLSHSLGDLRTALEAQGISVQKLQVSQAPKEQSSPGEGQRDGSQTSQDTAGRQEQQRKEMVQRMWRKLMNGQDPVDLVA